MAERDLIKTFSAPEIVSADLNQCDYLGVYLFNVDTINRPPLSGQYGICFTLSSKTPKNPGIGWVCQIVYDTRASNDTDNKLYIRKRINNNTWTAWSTIVSTYECVQLLSYEGTSQQTLNLNDNASKYTFIIYRLKDKNNTIVASSCLPYYLAKNSSITLYGENESQWGSIYMSDDGLTAKCNRTSANTNTIDIFGYGKK